MPVLAVNKQAKFNYELLKTYEAGLVLTGAEVKSAKMGRVNLRGSYISVRRQAGRPALYLVKAHISVYPYDSNPDEHEPERERELLLHKSELSYLLGKTEEKGLTLVPIKLYTKNGLIKLEFAVARGKKLHDKRESIKKREVERKMRRLMK